MITREKLSVFLETLANFHALGIATRELNPEFENTASKIPVSYGCCKKSTLLTKKILGILFRG